MSPDSSPVGDAPLPYYVCSRCGRRTFIPAEVTHRYCSRCRLFNDRLPAQAAQVGPENGTRFAPVAPVDSAPAGHAAHGRQQRLSVTNAGMRDTS